MTTEMTKTKVRLCEADLEFRKTPQFTDLLTDIITLNFDSALFGVRLSRARKDAHISQCELGKGIKVSGASISNIERGKSGNGVRKGIKTEQLMYFCDRLNVTPEYLLGFVDKPTEHIFFDDSEPFKVLQTLKKIKKAAPDETPSSVFRAVDPLCSDSEEVISKVKFIMHNLWASHFMLLFDLIQLAETPIVSYNFVIEIIRESFIGKQPFPSDLSNNDMLPVSGEPNPTYVQMVYQRLVRRRNIRIPDKKASYSVQCNYTYNVFVNILVDVGYECKSLLDNFTKIAALTNRDKKRAKQMLDGFVPVYFGNFDE